MEVSHVMHQKHLVRKRVVMVVFVAVFEVMFVVMFVVLFVVFVVEIVSRMVFEVEIVLRMVFVSMFWLVISDYPSFVDSFLEFPAVDPSVVGSSVVSLFDLHSSASEDSFHLVCLFCHLLVSSVLQELVHRDQSVQSQRVLLQ